MPDAKVLLPKEVSNPKPRKKKPFASIFQVQGGNTKGVQELLPPPKTKQKILRRSLKNEVSPSFQQPERSTSDFLPDSLRSGNEYRALRRKYLLLEEENFVLGRELREVEDEVKTLEDNKFALLDQLVVLEGLIDPSDLQAQGPPLL